MFEIVIVGYESEDVVGYALTERDAKIFAYDIVAASAARNGGKIETIPEIRSLTVADVERLRKMYEPLFMGNTTR